MSIASKPISGCSPIAAGSCYRVTLVTSFWGPTSEVFDSSVIGRSFVAEFWGPTSRVFSPVLVDPASGEGDCILVPAHDGAIIAQPHKDYTYACAFDDSADAPPYNDDVVVPGSQECKKEAA